NLMSNIPGLFVMGEANFSDHGANRLGASALMQGLADGYFVIPFSVAGWCATSKHAKIDTNHPAVKAAEADAHNRLKKLISIKGRRTVDSFHKELGHMMWEKCGMGRTDAGLRELLKQIPALKEEFWKNVSVTGDQGEINQVLERAG